MITRQHAADQVVTEDGVHHFVTEASTLSAIVPGFKDGWPISVETELGNGRPFIRHARKEENGELLYVRYAQDSGIIDLVVYND